MRRLARWLLNTLTMLSLLGCVAASAMWARSYRVRESLEFSPSPRAAFIVNSTGGLLELGGTRHVERVSRYWRSGARHTWLSHSQYSRFSGYQSPWPRLGISRDEGVYCIDLPLGGTYQFVRYTIAYPWIAGLAMALPALRAIRARWLSRRRRAGACQTCAYDLTSNVSGVCPECGTEILRPQA